MYKAIIFDLDGTLTASKQPLASDMAEVLKKLLGKMPVGVMSGADLPQFKNQFLNYLPSDCNMKNLFLFPTSAAECLTFDGKWKDAYDYQFTGEEKEKIIGALKKAAPAIEGEIWGEQIEDRGEQITWSALGQEAPLHEKEKWDSDHKKREAMREELLKFIPDFEISIGGATSIDITHKNISKEDGIVWLALHLGVKEEEMLYVGDALFEGGNDEAAKKTKIQTKQVSGPEETKKVIEEIISLL